MKQTVKQQTLNGQNRENQTTGSRFVNSGKPHSILNSNQVRLSQILLNYNLEELWDKTGGMFQEITVVGMKKEIVKLLNQVLTNVGIDKSFTKNSKRDKVEKVFHLLNRKNVSLLDFIDKENPENQKLMEEEISFSPEIRFNSYQPSDNQISVLSISLKFEKGNSPSDEDLERCASNTPTFVPIYIHPAYSLEDFNLPFKSYTNMSYRDILGEIVWNHPETEWIVDVYPEVTSINHSVDRIYEQSLYITNHKGSTNSYHLGRTILNEVIGSNTYPLHFHTLKYHFNISVWETLITLKEQELKNLEDGNNEDSNEMVDTTEVSSLFSDIECMENEIKRLRIIQKINKCSLRKEFDTSLDKNIIDTIHKVGDCIIEMEFDPSDGNYFVRTLPR